MQPPLPLPPPPSGEVLTARKSDAAFGKPLPKDGGAYTWRQLRAVEIPAARYSLYATRLLLFEAKVQMDGKPLPDSLRALLPASEDEGEEEETACRPTFVDLAAMAVMQVKAAYNSIPEEADAQAAQLADYLGADDSED